MSVQAFSFTKIVVAAQDVPQYKLSAAVVADPEGHLIELTTPLA